MQLYSTLPSDNDPKHEYCQAAHKPRMRTITECILMNKEDDPGSRLTFNALRNLVLSGKISSIKVGARKRLINYDNLLEFLSKGYTDNNNQVVGKIRAISE